MSEINLVKCWSFPYSLGGCLAPVWQCFIFPTVGNLYTATSFREKPASIVEKTVILPGPIVHCSKKITGTKQPPNNAFLYEPPNDKTNKMNVRPAKTQISLGIRPVWSESSMCAQYVVKDPSFLHADSEDSDQTGRMPRLIWVFTGRTCHFVGFVMRWLM